MKKYYIKVLYLVPIILFGVFIFIYGGYDDSPGAQLLGFLIAVISAIALFGSKKKRTINKVIILAAGKGTRMKSELPKVLSSLEGRPMISYLIDSVLASGLDKKPLILVSPDNQEIIKDYLKSYSLLYTLQKEALGTGHAVACAKNNLGDKNYQNIIVLYGDHPFISPESLRRLTGKHRGEISIMTTEVKDFNDWRKNFERWGRIMRNDLGEIEKIVEYRDASEKEKEIKELNPALYCFKASWLWDNIEKIKNKNEAGEYYLTDLIGLAKEQGLFIDNLKIEAQEALGINSPEELEVARNLLKK